MSLYVVVCCWLFVVCCVLFVAVVVVVVVVVVVAVVVVVVLVVVVVASLICGFIIRSLRLDMCSYSCSTSIIERYNLTDRC